MPTIPTRYGPLRVPGRPGDLIEDALRRYGEWGWLETRFIAALLPGDARVLDGGAFLGTFGLGLAMLRPLSALCTVEANSALLPDLAANLRLAPPGAAPRPGAAPADNASAASFLPGAVGAPIPAPPAAVTLAALQARHGSFDLVKLDVEGMELDILRADPAITDGRTTLWAECNEEPRALDLCALLLSRGLPVHLFAAPAHNPGNYAGDPRPALPWAYEAGLLAAPRQPPALDPDLRRHGCILRPIRSVDELTEAMWRIPRWGMPDWPLDDLAALAALAGRTIRNQPRDTFLHSAAPLGSPGAEMMWQRLMAAEARAAAAEARLAALGHLLSGPLLGGPEPGVPEPDAPEPGIPQT